MQILDFSGGSMAKNPHASAGDVGSIPGLGRSPGREHGNPLPIFLPRESHGQRSMEGYRPWGHRVGHDSMRACKYCFTP